MDIPMKVTEMTPEQRTKMRLEAKKITDIKIREFCANNPKYASYVKNCPDGMRKQYVETLTGESGKAQALKVMCYTCSGFDRNEVKGCTVKSCPLWNYRPCK